MNLVHKSLASIAIATTAFLLLADSADPRPCDDDPNEQTVSFLVEGTCGPTGSVSAHRLPKRCDLTLDGADGVGLGTQANFKGHDTTKVDGGDFYFHTKDGTKQCEPDATQTPGAPFHYICLSSSGLTSNAYDAAAHAPVPEAGAADRCDVYFTKL